ncbi:MAG: MFS transporter [Parvularculaceae bacterium]
MNKAPPAPRVPFAELVAVTAAAMAINAFAVDIMLPALGVIAAELGAARENDRQFIIIAYVLGNGIAQLFFGPVVDRFGRRAVLLWALAAYAAGSVLSIAASSFSLLIAARVFQGVSAAAVRVAAVAVVRDQYAGRRMAEVMSLAVTIFMAAPILAPAVGQAVLAVASWRWTFGVLLIFGLRSPRGYSCASPKPWRRRTASPCARARSRNPFRLSDEPRLDRIHDRLRFLFRRNLQLCQLRRTDLS